MKYFKKIEDAIVKVEFIVLVVLLIGMCFLSFAQVIKRNMFASSWVWADPLVKIAVLWVAIIGASIATTEKGHIHIDLLTRVLPEPFDEYLDAFLSLVAAGVCIFFYRLSYSFTMVRLAQGDFNFYLNTPEWIFTVVFPVGFAIMAMKFVLRFGHDLSHTIYGREEDHPKEGAKAPEPEGDGL